MMLRDFADRGGAPLVLTVPGLGDSDPSHWQSIWDATRGDCERADLGMWSSPRRNGWVTKLDHAIKAASAPVILAAHSLGCLAVAWWAALESPPYGHPVAGALLVAPPDCDRAGVGGALAGFAPTPRLGLPFPSIVVSSRDDPHASLARQRNMAQYWGSHFVDVGELGHVNAESGLGAWPHGQRLLDRLIQAADERAGGSQAVAAPASLALQPDEVHAFTLV